IAHRRGRTPQQVRQDVRAGLAECLRSGTTLLGDIASAGASYPELTRAPARATLFYEVLGLPAERAERARDELFAWPPAHPRTGASRVGISPHAPYSVRATLIHDVLYHAVWPVAIPLAESPAEMELLDRHEGPFVAFLRELGVWDPSGLVRSAGQVVRMAANGATRRETGPPAPVLFVHANYLDPGAPVPPSASVVYCPRTHAAFGHPPHPFRALLARGVRVALGTDSLASNPDLDLLAEARFLHRLHPDLAGDVLLRLATLAGAEALGWAEETGSLEAGKSADLVV